MVNPFCGPGREWPKAKWSLSFGGHAWCLRPAVWRFANCCRWSWLGIALVHPWFWCPDAAWTRGWDACYRDVFLPYQKEKGDA